MPSDVFTTKTVSITTAGGAGVAAGSGVIKAPFDAEIDWIDLDFHASAPATTDVTVSTPNEGTHAGNILVQANSLTDKRYHPGMLLDLAASGAASAITESRPRVARGENITFTIAQADALAACLVAKIRFRALGS